MDKYACFRKKTLTLNKEMLYLYVDDVDNDDIYDNDDDG
jgi:hypothetical protein